MKKRALIVMLVLALVLTLAGCGKTDKVEEAIGAIGTVTLDDAEAIAYAEELYYALSASEQGDVENAAVLIAARKEFDRLTAAVEYCIGCIESIGEVTLASGDAIITARDSFEALRVDDIADYASHMYPTLTKAEFDFDELCAQVLYAEARVIYNQAVELKIHEDYEKALNLLDVIVLTYPDAPTSALARLDALDCVVAVTNKYYQQDKLQLAYETLRHCKLYFGTNQEFDKINELLHVRLEQIRPANGKIFKSRSDNGLVRFRVIAEDKDVCLKLEEVDKPENYLLFYVRAGEEFTVHMDEGKYILKYTFGNYWFGEEDMFGAEGQYRQIRGEANANVLHGETVDIYDMYTEIISSDRTDRVVVLSKSEF